MSLQILRKGENEMAKKEVKTDLWVARQLDDSKIKYDAHQDVLNRTADFYQSLIKNEAYRDANILISTHGAASRCLLANFYEDKEDIWRGGVPKNCSVCIADVVDGVGTLVEKDKIYYTE